MKIAFQGVPGAYSELASRALFGAGAKALPFDTFENVFEAVDKARGGKGLADRGVIPIENSLAGSIHQNYDLLLEHHLHIVGETYLRVEHALLALPSARFQDIREVRSHPQALAQCSRFFAEHRNIKPVVWFDTAGAARSIAEEKPDDVAALASEYAGKLYGLKALRRGTQNEAGNFTRFLAIARNPSPPPRGSKHPCKTSIAFSAKNEAGSLYRILGVFASRKIDLHKIESRPDPASPFEYCFYIDFAGGTEEANVKQALAELRGLTRDLRVLGSYPRALLPKSKPNSNSRTSRKP
jgi:prephenate dehydratase